MNQFQDFFWPIFGIGAGLAAAGAAIGIACTLVAKLWHQIPHGPQKPKPEPLPPEIEYPL